MKIVILLALILAGCTDARIAQIKSLGEAGRIICYSGGKIIYEGSSTGKILTEEQSDGWFFQDTDGKLIRVSGDCLIKN